MHKSIFQFLIIISGISSSYAQVDNGNAVVVKEFQLQDKDQILTDVSIALKEIQGQPLVVTTDLPELVEKKELLHGQNIIVMPLGEAAKEQNPSLFRQVASQWAYNIKEGFQTDRTGFVLTMIVTSMDCYYWLHAGNLSTFQQYSSAAFSILIGATFGLNKQAWSRTVRPIQEFLKDQIYPIVSKRGLGPKRSLMLKFLSNFILASSLELFRVQLLPIDRMIQETMILNSWTLPFFLSLVSTLATSGWSEALGKMSPEKSPIGFFFASRASELKSLILGNFAATAMLLNPSIFGSAPWVVLGASGVIGLHFSIKTDQFTNWFENNPLAQKVFRSLKQLSTKLSCSRLFN